MKIPRPNRCLLIGRFAIRCDIVRSLVTHILTKVKPFLFFRGCLKTPRIAHACLSAIYYLQISLIPAIGVLQSGVKLHSSHTMVIPLFKIPKLKVFICKRSAIYIFIDTIILALDINSNIFRKAFSFNCFSFLGSLTKSIKSVAAIVVTIPVYLPSVFSNIEDLQNERFLYFCCLTFNHF